MSGWRKKESHIKKEELAQIILLEFLLMFTQMMFTDFLLPPKTNKCTIIYFKLVETSKGRQICLKLNCALRFFK